MRGGGRIEIGGVARAHGIRGEVAIALYNPDSTALEQGVAIYIGDRRFDVEQARHGTNGWLVKLAGVDDRNAAEALRGAQVEIDRDAVADDDDVLLDDLVGLRVELSDGTPWGEIVAVDAGPQDRLVIHDGGQERLLPMVDAFIDKIDVEAGVVTVTPPEGLPSVPIADGLGTKR
jgi:16S rRNA processing protein RimM